MWTLGRWVWSAVTALLVVLLLGTASTAWAAAPSPAPPIPGAAPNAWTCSDRTEPTTTPASSPSPTTSASLGPDGLPTPVATTTPVPSASPTTRVVGTDCAATSYGLPLASPSPSPVPSSSPSVSDCPSPVPSASATSPSPSATPSPTGDLRGSSARCPVFTVSELPSQQYGPLALTGGALVLLGVAGFVIRNGRPWR